VGEAIVPRRETVGAIWTFCIEVARNAHGITKVLRVFELMFCLVVFAQLVFANGNERLRSVSVAALAADPAPLRLTTFLVTKPTVFAPCSVAAARMGTDVISITVMISSGLAFPRPPFLNEGLQEPSITITQVA